uniref:Uncharacterized protein n=1 Tax=Opuntia streptacantha TaxID=393608 RepID=A0A7C9F124_OPUST
MQISLVRKGINQLNYIGIFKLFQQFNFSKGCKIHTFLLLPKANLLNCNSLIRLSVNGFVDNTISTFTKNFTLQIAIGHLLRYQTIDFRHTFPTLYSLTCPFLCRRF